MEDVRCAIPNLAAIRNHRGLSLREIADATKIRVFYLEAIESGSFEKLPGGVYSRSYVHQYAEAIQFDEAMILSALPPGPPQEDLPVESRGWSLVNRLLHRVYFAFAGGEHESRRTG